MALLEGQIRDQIAAGFAGKLLKGTITRTVPGGGLDANGDPRAPTTQTYQTQGFVESFSAYYRAASNGMINDTDVKILLIAGLTNTVPVKDDIVTFRGTAYQVRRILEIDPAQATYVLQGYQP